MTKQNKEPKPKGPQRKRVAEKLEQFSIRLPAKLKFGLEMLARAQHRSMTQSMEWALQVGLNSHDLGKPGELSLGSVVDEVWALRSIPARTMRLYKLAPSLLSFDELATCEFIDQSREMGSIRRDRDVFAGGTLDKVDAANMKDFLKKLDAVEQAVLEFSEQRWADIHSVATELANAGKSVRNISIANEFGVDLLILTGNHMQYSLDEIPQDQPE